MNNVTTKVKCLFERETSIVKTSYGIKCFPYINFPIKPHKEIPAIREQTKKIQQTCPLKIYKMPAIH